MTPFVRLSFLAEVTFKCFISSSIGIHNKFEKKNFFKGGFKNFYKIFQFTGRSLNTESKI